MDYDFLLPYEERLSDCSCRDDRETVSALLQFLDMLCLVSVYRNDELPDEALCRVGSLLSGTELVRAIEPHDDIPFPGRGRIRRIYDALFEKISASPSLRLNIVFNKGGLSDIERLAFILALSSSLNRKYERIYGVLQEEKEWMSRPTVGLCADLGALFLSKDECSLDILLSPDSFLNKYILSESENKRGGSEPERPLALHPFVLSFVLSGECGMGEAAICATYLYPSGSAYLCRKDKALELYSVYTAADAAREAVVIELMGESGSGRRFLVSVLSEKTGRPTLALDMRKLLTLDGKRQERIIKAVSLKAVFEEVILYLYGIEETYPGRFEGLFAFSRLKEAVPVVIIGVEHALSEKLEESTGSSMYRISLDEVSSKDQAVLWQEEVENVGAALSDDISVDILISKYTMTPGRIKKAVKNACFLSEEKDGRHIIKKEVLEEQIRRICAVGFGDTAVKLNNSFRREDLKLDKKSGELFDLAMERVRYRSAVMDGFGFGGRLPYGRGLSIVFYGPPGTGKTMAAQVLGNELGLNVYRIDLSRISSKYIGETEKNLSAVFEAAKNSNAILFFDEADSLFSKRTEVGNSNDKYANAETSYLLQKIEEYAGISVLATNNLQNFDAAFKRRFTFLIPVEKPDEATRRRLWEAAFPHEAPISREVDMGVLAGAIELTGSSIKLIAIDAAYMAAAGGREITYEDIIEACDRECAKNGSMGVGNMLREAVFLGLKEE